jgi:ACT domain-containing protein
MNKSEKLTPRQELLVDALASGLMISRAVEKVGVTRKTYYNWSELPHFQDALAQRRRELASRASERMDQLAATAITAVQSYISGEDAEGYGEPARVTLAMKLITSMGLLRPHGPRAHHPESESA